MRVVAILAVAILSCARSHPLAPAAAADPATAASATAASTTAASAATAAPPARAEEQPVATAGIHGTVAERIDTPQYSYLRLKTATGDVWTAVTKTDKAVGSQVTVVNAAWMENFKSTSLNRTWPRIAFGTLEEAGAPPAGAPSPSAPAAGASSPSALPAGAPAPSALPAADPSPSALPPGHPSTGGGTSASAGPDLGSIHVAKASGSHGRTVADVWARRAALKDQQVAVRGKVVKATSGVLGKNWLHLRDGSGQGPTSDLTVATDDTAAVGDTVLVTGVVHVDKDLGAGYRYEVIVENARVAKQ